MARLQDMQTVTPTSSDKLLIVQSQGQGLVPYGSKLDSVNPTGSGTFTFTGNGVLTGDLTIQGNVSLGLKTYSTTQNGVTYELFMMGKMGILTVKTGSFTNAVSANSTLVSLTDFSSDFTGKKFASSFQFNPTTDTSKRFDCGANTNTLITVHNLASGYAPRGCVPVVII